MKNRIIILGVAIAMASGFTSCKKENLGTVTTQTTTNAVSKGKWTVAEFEVNGVNHSSFYNGYTFDFMQGGVLMASGNGRKVGGTWSTGISNQHESLKINFGSNDPFNLLNSDWEIGQETSTTMELKGSRGDDGTETLVLKKF